LYFSNCIPFIFTPLINKKLRAKEKIPNLKLKHKHTREKMSEGSPKVEKKEKPKKEKKEKKDGALFKAKKNLAGKAATSGLGKSVLNKLLDDNSNQIIKSMKRIITIHSDKKKATEIHDTIIKILIKAHFQIEKKNVDPTEFALGKF
jgi:hypothetical protein